MTFCVLRRHPRPRPETEGSGWLGRVDTDTDTKEGSTIEASQKLGRNLFHGKGRKKWGRVDGRSAALSAAGLLKHRVCHAGANPGHEAVLEEGNGLKTCPGVWARRRRERKREDESSKRRPWMRLGRRKAQKASAQGLVDRCGARVSERAGETGALGRGEDRHSGRGDDGPS
ncbi:hypothetical protein CDD83_6645 [Cordyceps sp. RAO-2017]|nr:hypothetical protein CDD83_6645 [Cordyceps sp. RAO-2017]